MPTRLYTPAEAVEFLGKSEDYWSRRAREKRVDHVRVGASIRFTAEQIDAIIEAGTVRAAAEVGSLAAVVELAPMDAMAAAAVTRGRRAAR